MSDTNSKFTGNKISLEELEDFSTAVKKDPKAGYSAYSTALRHDHM